jgi:hypothetical protein
VPLLLAHRGTRFALGYPCLAAAQLLNWQALGLDGWWLLLLGGWLAWAPPVAAPRCAAALAGAARRLASGEPCRGGPRPGARPSLGKQQAGGAVQLARLAGSALQPQQPQQQQQQAGQPDSGGVAMLSGGAWSSWFLEGAPTGGAQRRVPPRPPGLADDDTGPAVTPAPAGLPRWGVGGGGPDGGRRLPLRSWLALAPVLLLCLYHVVTPLSFLAYPSK